MRRPDEPTPQADRQPGRRPSAASFLFTSRPTTAPSPADANTTQPLDLTELRATIRAGSPAARRPPTPPTRPAHPPATPSSAPPLARPQHIPPISDALRPTQPDERRRVLSTWLFLALGVLLAIAVIIGAGWWVTISAGEQAAPPAGAEPPSKTPTSTAGTSAPAPSSLLKRLPALPGLPNAHNGRLSVAKAAELELFTAGEAKVLAENGVREVVWLGSAEGDVAYAVLVAPSRSSESAQATTQALLDRTSPGLDAAKIAGHQGLASFRRVDSSSNIYFTVYTSGSYTVRAAIARIPAGEPSGLAGKLSGVLSQLRPILPPD